MEKYRVALLLFMCIYHLKNCVVAHNYSVYFLFFVVSCALLVEKASCKIWPTRKEKASSNKNYDEKQQQQQQKRKKCVENNVELTIRFGLFFTLLLAHWIAVAPPFRQRSSHPRSSKAIAIRCVTQSFFQPPTSNTQIYFASHSCTHAHTHSFAQLILLQIIIKDTESSRDLHAREYVKHTYRATITNHLLNHHKGNE